jgi:hypothetical protein
MFSRPLAGALVAAASFAVLAGVAGADTYRFTAAGQAAARTAVVARGDLGSNAGWTGGFLKPDTSSAHDDCAAFPETPGRYVVGSTRTVWRNTGVEIESDADVVRTPEMAETDWRLLTSSEALGCVRALAAKGLTAHEQIVSVARHTFAHVGRHSTAFRVIINLTVGGQTIRMMGDLIYFSTARTEMSLMFVAPVAAAYAVEPAEVRLASLLAERAAV